MFNSALSNALHGKSKTVNLNLVFAAIAAAISVFEPSIDPKIYITIQTILNIFLRFTTTLPLEDK